MNTPKSPKSALASAVYFFVALTILIPINAWSQIEEVVVTVRKREENLQDVPISVDAFTSAEIDRKGISDITDVARLSPSIQFDESFAQSDTRITVRGLSPTRGRQNVALLLDGIDVSSEAISSSGGSLLLNTRLVDIERIEVILGPQMALYGRSAFAGAIQYITKDPSEELEGQVKVDVSDFNRFSATGSVSGPIAGDALGFRFNAAWWDEDGYYQNTITNEEVGGDKGVGLALTFKSEIGDRVSLKFRSEYTDDEGQPSAAAFLPFNTELATPLEATELLFDEQGNMVSAGISECFNGQNGKEDFIGKISAGRPLPGNAAPGTFPDGYLNDEFLQARTDRISDPNFLSGTPGSDLNQFLIANGRGPLPGAADPTVPTGGVSSQCEWIVPVRVGKVPDGDDLPVTLAPNPATPGKDYEGFDRELLRFSLVADVDFDAFTFTSLTGYTRDDTFEAQDANAFAFHSPDAGIFLDGNAETFAANNDKTTEQFSQEFRIATQLDGPVNGTFGVTYWDEKVDNDSTSITAESAGSHCMWNSKLGMGGTINPIGIQSIGCPGFTESPVAPFQNAAQPFRNPSPSDRDTEHFSVYGMLEFELTETWGLTLEGRYNEEDVKVFGPIFLDPGASGGPGGLNPCGIFFRPCQSFDIFLNGDPDAVVSTLAQTGNGRRPNGSWFGDAFFPFVDDFIDANLDTQPFLNANGEQEFRVDQAMLDQIPDECRNTPAKQAAVDRSIIEGPSMIVTETNSVGQLVPKHDNRVQELADAQGEIVRDANGRVIRNPNATDMFNPWCQSSLKDSDDWFSPKITLDWEATDNSLYYVSWSKARKPGGFSLLTVGSSGLDRELTEFDPEEMEVWEIGGKTSWVENSLVINGAFFFQDFTDKQALTSALGNDGRLVSKIENAGSAEVWGAELSVAWSPLNPIGPGHLSISGGYTFLDTEYTDFTVESGSSTNAAAAGNCTPILVGGEPLCTLSYTGNELENAPQGAFNGFVNYTIPVSGGADFYVEADAIWQDKRFADFTNNLWMDAYWNFDVRFGFQTDRWNMLFYIDNVLDDRTVRSAGGGPALGCCFVLGSSIDLGAVQDFTKAVPTESEDVDFSPRSVGAGVMVDLPLFKTGFLPPPRVIGFRMDFRFGGSRSN